MSKEKLITTVEEGFALNLDEGDCALTKSARPAWDEQVKLSQGSLPRAPVIKPTVFTCGPGPIKVTLHSEILGSLSFPPPISSQTTTKTKNKKPGSFCLLALPLMCCVVPGMSPALCGPPPMTYRARVRCSWVSSTQTFRGSPHIGQIHTLLPFLPHRGLIATTGTHQELGRVSISEQMQWSHVSCRGFH